MTCHTAQKRQDAYDDKQSMVNIQSFISAVLVKSSRATKEAAAEGRALAYLPQMCLLHGCFTY